MKDFTPFACKIVASGAQAVITGKWDADVIEPGKAIIAARFKGFICACFEASVRITRTFEEVGKVSIFLVE